MQVHGHPNDVQHMSSPYPGLMVVGVLALLCGGCIDRLMQATMAPQAAVAESLAQVGTKAAQAGANDNSAAVRDIDRILEQNPGAANSEELRSLRSQLAGSRASGGVPASDMQSRSLSRRDTPLDRSLPMRKSDKPRLLPPSSPTATGIAQPPTPMVFTSQVPREPAKRWIMTDVSPVRLR